MGGKNSVFNKPLGTGSGSVNKAIDRTPLKAVKKVYNDINENIGPKKVGDTYKANKAGIDGVVGLASRGAMAYYTLGASELIGAGDLTTKQFGTKNDFAQYGKAVGTVGGIAGAGAVANGSHLLNTAGYINAGSSSATVANVVSKISGSGGTGGAMRGPASITNEGDNVNFLDNLTGGKGDDFWSNVGNIGLDYLNNNVLNNGGGKDRNVPVAQPSYQNFPTQQPALQAQSSMDQKTMLMIGGGLVLVLLLVKR